MAGSPQEPQLVCLAQRFLFSFLQFVGEEFEPFIVRRFAGLLPEFFHKNLGFLPVHIGGKKLCHKIQAQKLLADQDSQILKKRADHLQRNETIARFGGEQGAVFLLKFFVVGVLDPGDSGQGFREFPAVVD